MANTVFVEYDGGINHDTEEDINTAAGYTFDNDVKCDSGCMMVEPYTRDLCFRYPTAEQAAKAAEKLRELNDVRVKTELEA